jgi:hypothetical protein
MLSQAQPGNVLQAPLSVVEQPALLVPLQLRSVHMHLSARAHAPPLLGQVAASANFPSHSGYGPMMHPPQCWTHPDAGKSNNSAALTKPPAMPRPSTFFGDTLGIVITGAGKVPRGASPGCRLRTVSGAVSKPSSFNHNHWKDPNNTRTAQRSCPCCRIAGKSKQDCRQIPMRNLAARCRILRLLPSIRR